MSDSTREQELLIHSNGSTDQRKTRHSMEDELVKLRVENKRLMAELAEKDTAVQNLFSYIQSSGGH